jgi:arylsulfatase A-like enzyme
VQAYLACVASVDKQVGRVLDALEASGKAGSTIVVLTSDNGMHRGEKEQYEKWTLWSRSTRVPLIISVPGGVKGGQCREPVELLDIYPTLLDLCGLPPVAGLEGLSLRPQLADPSSPRKRPALTTWYPNNHGIQTKEWNYIRYADGTEELYDKKNDPNEWTNLAGTDAAKKIVPELTRWLPSHNERPVPGSDYIAVPQVVRDREDWTKN